MASTRRMEPSYWPWVLGIGGVLACITASWYGQINTKVPEPYLDEFFHVRQAQVYCSGDFKTWDPKITTPPGLYLISWLVYRLTGRCSIESLRGSNVFTVLLGWFYTYTTFQALQKRTSKDTRPLQLNHSLSALNIWLFPPLFFFSGLYYTDVQSAFWVLLSFQSYLRYQRRGFTHWSDAFSQFKFGVIALFFRQTNIFWVALFPAGLALIALAEQAEEEKPTIVVNDESLINVLPSSWNSSILYNPLVHDGWLSDYVLAAMSLVVVIIRNWRKTSLVLLPYLFLVAVFAGFVFWNGGVVLGDKSNHVATIHLPQMLYLWPYILFFSWPLVAHSVITGNINPPRSSRHFARTVGTLLAITIFAMAVLRYNTIIHPFTLADNRHYVFYVFGILRRYPALQIGAAPIYILSGYVVIQSLGAKTIKSTHGTTQRDELAIDNGSVRNRSCTVNFVSVWLVTTALSLITAPLVEPRYCIIPWMMWRLHVPIEGDTPRETIKDKPENFQGRRTGVYAIAVETAWFLVVFAVTGYMFLMKPFAWPQEPGKSQRFMW